MLRRFQMLSIAVMLTLVAGPLRGEKNPADYPLRVTIFTKNGVTHYHNGYPDFYRGSGKADLHDGDKVQGFDYTYECSDNFMPTSSGEYIAAKWNKKGEKLVLLLQEIGKEKYHECEMKLTLIDGVYRRNAKGFLVAVPMAEFEALKEQNHPVDADMKDYPLRVTLVQVRWSQTAAGFAGAGSGNVKDGDTVHGFDFTANCARAFGANHPGTAMHARWLGNGGLEIFGRRAGDPNDTTVCDMQTSLQPFIYIRYASGQVQTYTDAQYTHWVEAQRKDPTALPDPQILERPFSE